MSKSGIKILAKIIEYIKKNKLPLAELEYKNYSGMPKGKVKSYIESLEEKVLKGEIDVGNISEEEIELFNEKPNEDDLRILGNEKKKKMKFVIVGIVVFLGIIFIPSIFNDGKSSEPEKPKEIVRAHH